MKMMNLIGSKWNLYGISRITVRNLFRSYSTPPSDSLYRRISVAGHPTISMSSILDQWVQEGRDIELNELRFFLKKLRTFRRFNHALQISEWMSNERNLHLSSGDIAIRLDLISKVHGLDQTEKYFSSIPDNLRDYKVYGAILNCYGQHKSVEKAEAMLQYIKEYAPEPVTYFGLSYNVLLKLYAQIGEYGKLDALMQEMEEKKICNNRTFTTRLHAYVTASDIDGMEKFLAKIEGNPVPIVDWMIYSTAANGYAKAGHVEKSCAVLKKAEELVNPKQRMAAFESFLTVYGAIGKKDDVYRIWNVCKRLCFFRNSTFIRMLTALAMLDDIDGAERIVEEWESEHKNFDVRIPNLMVGIYCKNGLLENAEAYVGRLLERDIEVDGGTWEPLARGYHKNNDMDNAVRTMKKAILASQPRWKPFPYTFAACIEHLKDKGDLELALEILMICRERGHISASTIDRLSSYVHGEILETNALNLLEGECYLKTEVEVGE